MTVPTSFSGKKVLVTGANGFIGSHLCRRLHNSGADVHGVYRTRPGSVHDDFTRWWPCDLADADEVKNLLVRTKPDVIFHLASHVAGSRSLELILPTYHSNLSSTVNLLTAATELGCHRIVLTGSMEEPAQSNSDITPSSPYAAAKWAGSAYARMFHALYQTPVTIARVFMVYGPGQRDLNKLIPYTILSLLGNRAPELTSGERQIDWIFVDDVVDGLLSIAQAPNVEGRTIDIGSGEQVSIRDLVLRLVTVMNSSIEPSFGTIPDRPMEQTRLANISKTYAETGWKPKTSIENGLRQTIEWYKSKR